MNNNSSRIFPQKVYYVFSFQDETVLVALDVEIRENLITWFDTNRERAFYIEKILVDTPSEFTFKTPEGKIYTLMPLTLEIYRKKVKDKLLLPKDFQSEEEMRRAFEKTKESAW